MVVGRQKVAVIGGGSSGIVSLFQLLSLGFDVTVFEAAPRIGGAWVLNAEAGESKVEFDAQGQAWFNGGKITAMYPGLRTNVPSLVMEFRVEKFPPTESLFPGPDGVRAYLEAFTEKYRLNEFIRLNSKVTRLRYTAGSDGGDQRKWYLETNGGEGHDQFDFILVANGHYSKPYIPRVPGLQTFTGKVEHSKWYRDAENYAGLRTLVVGNGASGYDISREVAGAIVQRRDNGKPVGRIYQSERSTTKPLFEVDATDEKNKRWYDVIERYPTIASVEGSKITFSDGRTLGDVDTIIFASGYYFNNDFAHVDAAPFDAHPLTVITDASGKSVPSTFGRRLHHLDELQFFYVPDPTLALTAINYAIIPFPVAEIQSRLAGLFWLGLVDLDITEGISESEPEELTPHVRGADEDYDYQDRLATAIAEQSDWPEIEKRARAAQETLSKKLDIAWPAYESFPLTSRIRRDLRTGSRGLRRDVVGY